MIIINSEELEIYKCLTSKSNITINIRGNSWLSTLDRVRSACSYPCIPILYAVDLGFRCVRKVKNEC